MKLYIDPTGGIAGDMIISALVSVGADPDFVIQAVERAIKSLGEGKAAFITLQDGATRLQLDTQPAHSHLGSIKGRNMLENLFEELRIDSEYIETGLRAFDILSTSETKAHKLFNIHMGHHHGDDQAWLHEAQDIVIDIAGTIAALQSIGEGTETYMTAPVSVGGGSVTCSHGELDIPAPAVQVILQDFAISWVKGPIEKELCTPTGSAILAALTERSTEIEKLPEEVRATGCARGSGDFPIPPLKFYMI